MFIDPIFVCNKVIPFPGTPLFDSLKAEGRLYKYNIQRKSLTDFDFSQLFNYDFSNKYIGKIFDTIILARNETVKDHLTCKTKLHGLLENPARLNKVEVDYCQFEYGYLGNMYLDFLKWAKEVILKYYNPESDKKINEFDLMVRDRIDEMKSNLSSLKQELAQIKRSK